MSTISPENINLVEEGWSYQLVCIVAVAYLIIPAMVYAMSCLNAPSELIKAFMNETQITRTGKPMPENQIESLFGLLVAVVGIGAGLGCAFSDTVADRIGRKYSILIAVVMGCVGTLTMALCKVAESYEMLFVGRVINGLSLGLGITLSMPYIMEMCLPHQKGTAAMANTLSQSTAVLAGQILGYQELLGNKECWTYLIGVPLIPLVAQLILFPFCPQNPRYLLLKKKDEVAACKAFQKVRGRTEVHQDIKFLRQEIVESATNTQVSTIDLFLTPRLRRPLIIAIVMGLHQNWCGMNALLFFSTELFEDAGLTGASARYATSAGGAFFVVGNVLAAYLLRVIGRKTQFVGGTISIGVFCAVFSIITMFEDKADALKYVNIVVAMIIVVSIALGPASVFWVVLGEILPHSARGAGFSVAVLCASIGMFTHNYVLPEMWRALHAYTFLVFTGIDAIMVTFCIFFMPETRNKTFAEIAVTWTKPGDATTPDYLDHRLEDKKESPGLSGSNRRLTSEHHQRPQH